MRDETAVSSLGKIIMSLQYDNSRIVWQGDSWRLRVDTAVAGDGRIVERGAIEHPGAVVLVPVTGRLILHSWVKSGLCPASPTS